MSDADSTAPVEYRPIPNFPGYRVGSDGSVWSCKKRWHRCWILGNEWHRVKGRPNRDGYLSFDAWHNGKTKTLYVHVIVLEIFVGPRPQGMYACHDPDPTPSNCALINLKWATPSENIEDSRRHGTERHPSKLSDADIRLAVNRIILGEDVRAVASEVGLHPAWLRAVACGRQRTNATKVVFEKHGGCLPQANIQRAEDRDKMLAEYFEAIATARNAGFKKLPQRALIELVAKYGVSKHALNSAVARHRKRRAVDGVLNGPKKKARKSA